MHSSNLIIVPDVHGRDFWRAAVKNHPDAFYVFLGDYLDPYPSEGYTVEDAISGLKDIIAMKKKNPDRVVLLWGNHDLHYLYPQIMGSRYDIDRGLEIAELFFRYQELFQICVECEAGGKRFLFSHAGICRKWLESYYPDINCENVSSEKINSLVLTENFEQAFSVVSMFRGGNERAGSPVWSDVRDHLEECNMLSGVVQVFGHTMVKEPLNIDGEIYCLDCQRCFSLSLETGELDDLT